jgi:hypothetical protein
MLWTLLVFVVWIAAWHFVRARDRRNDVSHRLAARRRVRFVGRERGDDVSSSQKQ